MPRKTAGQWRNLAWLPVPLLAAAIVALWVADMRVVWTLPFLYGLVQYGSGILGIVFIVIPAARSFAANGQPTVLMLGCGVLMSQIGAFAMPFVPGHGLNQGFAIYNTSVLLSALFQCTGVAIASRRKVPLVHSTAWLTYVYLGGMGLMGLVIWGSLTNMMPVFFVDGQGGTLLRSLAVSAAVALFLATSGLLWRMHRRSPSPFLFWYALGLVLLATGLAGSMVIAVRDSPLQWVTRSTQVLGLVYMCIAALASARKTGVWQVPGEFTLRKQAEESLRESEEKYRRLIETASEGIMMGGLDGRITFANKKISDMLGYSIDELVGEIGLDFMPADQKEKVIAARTELIKKNNVQIEVCFLRKDGSRLWTIGSYAPITDHTGEHTGNLAMYTDITRRKKTEEALRISEERYHNLFSTMEEGFCIIEMIFDKEGRPADYRFLEINSAFEKQTGLHGAEGKLMRELAPAHEAYWFEIYGNVALTGESIRFVNEAKALNRWFEVYAYRIGKPEERQVVIVFNDISENKRAEAALRESEARFRSTMDNMLEGCQILNRQWQYVYINDAAERQNRRPRAELMGKRYMDIWPGIESTHVFSAIGRCLEEGKAETWENEFTFPDGAIGWFDLTIQPVPEGVFILSMDVTVRKKAEAVLPDAKTQKQVAQYSRNLLETSLDPLVTISAEGKITDANAAAVRATGMPKEDLIGTDFSIYFTEPEKADLGYRQVFEQGSAIDYPLTIRHKNGSLMNVLYNAAVYKDEGGNVLGVFAAARDVTARKRAEEELAVHQRHLEGLVAARTAELQKANQDLRGSRRAALNLLKDAVEARRAVEQAEEGLRRSAEDLGRSNKDLEQFAYVASHDLQEPLRAVGGFMGLLKNQYYNKLDDQAREYIDFSVEGAERMQSLIEGLLAFSRVGTRGGEFAPIGLESAFNAATANLKFLITESQAAITSDPLPVVTADLLQMTQLLQNLIANAVKFHGPLSPKIHIGAQRKERAWEICVRDNGIGIDSQYFDRIFLIFQRLHTRTQYKGTGIGLAVCKKIVERHGGKIWVESVPGQGSTFRFTIPDKGESA